MQPKGICDSWLPSEERRSGNNLLPSPPLSHPIVGGVLHSLSASPYHNLFHITLHCQVAVRAGAGAAGLNDQKDPIHVYFTFINYCMKLLPSSTRARGHWTGRIPNVVNSTKEEDE